MQSSASGSTSTPRGSWRYGLTANVALLAAASLLTDVSSEMILPLLPFFLLSLGGTPLLLGVIEGVADAVVSLVKVVSGHRSDAVGARKRFVSTGYGLSALAKLLLPFASSWLPVLAARVGDRGGKGVREPPRDALLADSTPEETRGKAFGFHRAMDTTGAILGPLLAIGLIALGWAYSPIFLLAAVPAAAAFAVALLVRERPRAPVRRPLFGSLAAIPRPARRYFAVTAVFSVANLSVLFFLLRGCQVLTGGSCSAETSLLSTLALYVAFNVVYALLAFEVGRLSDRVGRPPMVLAGYLAFAASATLFVLVPRAELFLPLFLLLGASYALVDGSQRALVVDLVPADQKGTSLGAYHGLNAAAKLASGVLAGLLYVISPSLAFAVAAGLALVAALALPRAVPLTRSASPSA